MDAGNNIALFTVSQCLLIAGLVVRPSPYRWMLWPLIASINCYCFFRCPPSETPTSDGLRLCALALYVFVASDYILLTDVQRELRLVDEDELISDSRLWLRVKWGLRLFFNPRGVGWAHRSRSVPPPRRDLTRLAFVFSQLGWLAAYILIADAASIMMRADPFFVKNALPFAQQPLLWRCWGVVLFAISSTTGVSIVHTVFSVIFVATGLSNPHMWPPLFGNWLDAYTVRRFWA